MANSDSFNKRRHFYPFQTDILMSLSTELIKRFIFTYIYIYTSAADLPFWTVLPAYRKLNS